MAKQVQRAIGWVAAFLLAVGLLFLPVSKAYAGPVSGGSPGSGEMRGVWVSYLDWNGWAKDEAGYKKVMDQTLDLCVQKGLNAVFLQVRPDGDAMYPSQYFPWSKFASGKQGKNPGYDPLAYAVQAAHQRGLQLHAWINPYRITGYLNRYSDLCASNPAIAWAKDGDSSNDRWVLCQNGVITWELMVERLNSDLANILGNLVKRTVSMTNQYFGGVVADKGVTEPVDEDLKKVVLEAVRKVDEKMDKLRVADAITEIFNIFRRSNKYIDETTPWILAKEEDKQDRLATVLYNLVESITIGASLLESFMPETSEKILKELNTVKRELPQMDAFGRYPSGNKVTEEPEVLFARLKLDDVMKKVKVIQEEQKKAVAAKAEPEKEEDEKAEGIDIEPKAEITYDDFAKLQFQVGVILSCEAVPKSKKLLCSQVQVGSQVRQIVSGIKHSYSPEEMVGKRVMVVTNLKPAKLAGILSEGMILCAEDAEGKLSLMTTEKDMPAGAEIC